VHPDEGGVLIDASNLRSGGAVQVAASFLDELDALRSDSDAVARFPWIVNNIEIRLSDAVRSNMSSATVNLPAEDRTWHDRRSWTTPHRRFDVSFQVFGPEYSRRRARVRIVGFADGVSLFALPAQIRHRSRTQEVRWTARAAVSKFLFRAADVVIVEAAHVRETLITKWGISRAKILIVPNVVNQVFRNDSDWSYVSLPPGSPYPKICYVTRAYAHKNIDFLGEVGLVLTRLFGIEVRFLLTLDQEEWASRSETLKRYALNLGPLVIAQVPSVYKQSTIAIFPSLLESLSVSPLEALACGCALAASDRAFVRDVIGEGAALYFDPHEPEEAASQLARLLGSRELRERLIRNGRNIAHKWPTARDRAWSYLEIIDSALR
jgi:glycosyltransferase involved in cell wall biosynthesis